MPTKTEQSDLFQAVYGRNADTPLPVIASATPGDCFEAAIEAVRLATRYMTPVILLTDGYLANAAEPWQLPDLARRLPKFPVNFRDRPERLPSVRARPRNAGARLGHAGNPRAEHRIGGIEKSYDSGHISYDPENHQKMTRHPGREDRGNRERHSAAAGGAGRRTGRAGGGRLGIDLRRRSTRRCAAAGRPGFACPTSISGTSSRSPRTWATCCSGFDRVLVPEMNNGQLVTCSETSSCSGRGPDQGDRASLQGVRAGAQPFAAELERIPHDRHSG